MKQSVRFASPVLAATNGTVPVVAGATVRLILKDFVHKDVVATAVREGGKVIEWDLTTDGIPRAEDVVSVHGRHQHNYPAYMTQGYEGNREADGADPVLSGS